MAGADRCMRALTPLTVVFLLVAADAFASSCGQTPVAVKFHLSDAVFVGRLSEIERATAFSDVDLLATFRVEQWWKGSMPSMFERVQQWWNGSYVSDVTIAWDLGPGLCGEPSVAPGERAATSLARGQRYIVYAKRQSIYFNDNLAPRLTVNLVCCSSHLLTDRPDEVSELRELDEIGRSQERR